MIEFRATSAYPDEHLNRNIEHARSLGLPDMKDYRFTGPVAVVGGGLSSLGYVETLRRWEGPVWAINGAWQWCWDNRIDATFFSIDPNPSIAEMADGAREAILAERCDPKAFQSAARTHIYSDNVGGCSSAGAAICAGVKSGQVTLFGCECNYQTGRSHIYGHKQPQYELIVKCAGMHFLTQPNLVMQARELAIMLLEAPQIVRETSGGFLRAMINTGCEYQLIEHTPGFEKTLVPASG